MNILLLNQHFYPEIAATSQLATDLAQDLVRNGLSVTVVAGMPSYLENDTSLCNLKTPKQELWMDIHIHRVFTTSFRRHSKLGRMINYLSFYLFALWKIIWLPRHSIIISMSTPPYLSLLGVFIKKVKKTKLLFWLQDVYPDLAVGFSILNNKGFLTRFLQGLSRFIYRRSDMIVAIGQSMKEHLLKEKVVEYKIKLIDNWADPNDFIIDEKRPNPIREMLGITNKFVVVYSGNMGIVHDFAIVEKALSHYKDSSHVAFLFIGDGKKKIPLQEYVQKNQISNVFFLNYQPREMLGYSLRSGDVALITQDKRAVGLVMPSKFYGCIAAERPILAVAPSNSELSQMIQTYQCGCCSDNDDESTFYANLDKLIQDTSFYTQCQNKAKETFTTYFARHVATSKFIEVLNTLETIH